MVARTDAAAHCSSRLVLCFLLFIRIYVWVHVFSITIHWVESTYSRQDLLNLELVWRNIHCVACHQFHGIPEEIIRAPGSPWLVLPSGKPRKKCKQRRQKFVCRVSLLVWLTKQRFKPLLPSIFLSNVRPITNKSMYRTAALYRDLAAVINSGFGYWACRFQFRNSPRGVQLATTSTLLGSVETPWSEMTWPK